MKKQYTYDYPMPAITADVVVFHKMHRESVKVLLIKRKNEPYKDCWALPGGFMNIDETLENCAMRELYEETGLLTRVVRIGVLDKVDRDPRGRVISHIYIASALYGTGFLKAGDDAESLAWFSQEECKDINLAFGHKEAVDLAFEFLNLMLKKSIEKI
jgi:8-oxo-dGTP diphosphatase